MKAVILAAGKGTRMRELTKNTPKPLLRIGDKTLLEIIMSGIKSAGVSEFIIVTGYLGDKIADFFGNGARFGCSINYVRQEKQNGTAKAINLCQSMTGSSDFFMTYGDIIISPQNYPMMREAYYKHKLDVLSTINHVDDPAAGAAVYINGADEKSSCRKVVKIIEKPPAGTSKTNWNNAGVFIFSPLIYKYSERVAPSPRGEYELTSALHDMLEDALKFYAMPISGVWSDVGNPEELAKMQGVIL